MIVKIQKNNKPQQTAPFVKWAGGKGQLVERLKERMPTKYKAYYEPFIGAGALFFAISTEKPSFINDTNSQLINAYKTIRDNSNDLISMVQEMDEHECTKEHYYMMRNNFNEKVKNQIDDVETAALFIYLNKHCFNGLYRVNSKGLFNVPWNNKTKGSSINVDNIKAISEYLTAFKVNISNDDFEVACSRCKSGDFVYFDSPYDVLSKTSSFADYTKESFKEGDHQRLAALYTSLSEKGVKCMLTNHNTPLVNELYKDYKMEVVSVRRAINADATNRTGQEVIVTNY